MKKLGQLASLLLAIVMLVSVMSVASAEGAVPEGYPEIITDANGNPIDLGGMHIIMADYWSSGVRNENPDARTEAQYAFQDWFMETYNFTMVSESRGDWGTNLDEFINFVSAPDGTFYCWQLRPDVVAQPMKNNMLYDLATLDCLDFADDKWNSAETAYMTAGDSIYGSYVGNSEVRQGIYFNYRLLEDAGIDPDDLYDMQANGEWTWDAFEEAVKQCARDLDNDGVNDVWGMANNMDDFYLTAVFSNGGSFFDYDENGKIKCTVTNDEAVEALNWACRMRDAYQQPQPTDSNWDWYKENFKTGKAAFYCYQAYGGFNANAELAGMEDDWGFLAFPKGPKADHHITVVSDNITVIPNVYDADTAWKIAFALDLWTDPVPGYEDDDTWMDGFLPYARDDRSVEETYAMLREPENCVTNLTLTMGSINDVLGDGFFWSLSGATPAELIEAKMPAWQSYMDIANGVAAE